MLLLLPSPRAFPKPGGTAFRIVSRWLESSEDRDVGVMPPLVMCRPSTLNNSGAATFISEDADANWMPEAFATRLVTAPALSPRRLEMRPEPVFIRFSVAPPPPNRLPMLPRILSGDGALDIADMRRETPAGVDAVLQAAPARVGTMVSIAC
jgi:hypothetical protein